MSHNSLVALVKRFRGQRVLVLGDVMLDRYIWGEATRISPEAPVPIVQATRESARLGGAGNVAANIQALGGDASLVGVMGSDTAAHSLADLLTRSGVPADGMVSSETRPTTVKTRVIARNQQVVRVDMELEEPLDAETRARLTDRLAALVPTTSAVLISDYGKGAIDADVLSQVLSIARHHGVPVAVDPKEEHFFDYKGVAVITPNLVEASNALGRRLRTDEEVVSAGEELRSRLEATSVLITRGERGMSLFEADTTTHLATVAEDVYDVTGAGDTVISTFTLCLAAGGTLPEAAELANVAASLAVREVGTTAVSHGALLAALEGRH